MMKRSVKAAVSLLAALAVLFSLALSAAALDDTYRFDEYGMSLKISKNYHVITRDTPEDDEVFTTLKLSKDEAMSEFESGSVYLRAYDPEYVLLISLTVNDSSDVNSLSELSDAERRNRLDAISAKAGVTDVVERKHGGLTFFDVKQESTRNGEPLYIVQCETVVNGKCFDLYLQKEKEAILQNEEDVLYNIAASIEFDRIDTADSGPVFSWWRVLLWIVILVALSVVISIIYKHQNAVRKRRLEERRQRRLAADTSAENSAAAAAADPDSSVTFDEFLGYHEADRFSSRAATDLDSFDISVREKDPTHGIEYFEDEGKSIDDRGDDYFDNYFREPTPRRSGISRLFSSIGAYIGIGFRHLGYFFKNLFKRKPKDKKPK